jgi:hypothetical protein
VRAGGVQKVAVAGALAMCKGHTGRGGLGGVLAGLGRGDGVLWVGAGEATLVGSLQRGRGTEKGGPGGFFLLLPSLTASVGAEGAGNNQGGFPGMAIGFERR